MPRFIVTIKEWQYYDVEVEADDYKAAEIAAYEAADEPDREYHDFVDTEVTEIVMVEEE